MADEFSFDIVEKFGALSEGKAGWTTELNSVSWGGRPAKFDIRSWSPDHQKMGKGITLSAEELSKLRDILDGMKLDAADARS